VERIQREEQIKVQDAEVKRRERELEATILKVAEAEKQRILTLAEAERQRRILEAEGQSQAVKVEGAAGAEVTRIKGQATADVTRLQGQAEADIILSKGRAEAEAMSNRAGAYHEYNQAAILDRLLAGFPEIVRAVAEPLSKVDRITIVSTDGNQTGANKLTGDMVKIIAQVPALFETLAGVKLSDLLAKVPALSAEFERARSEVACADDQAAPGAGAAGAPATEGKRKK
jgi:flotillin